LQLSVVRNEWILLHQIEGGQTVRGRHAPKFVLDVRHVQTPSFALFDTSVKMRGGVCEISESIFRQSTTLPIRMFYISDELLCFETMALQRLPRGGGRKSKQKFALFDSLQKLGKR